MESFLTKLSAMPAGYSRVIYNNQKWGVTIERLANGRQIKLYGEQLGGADHVSFNLYLPTSGKVLLKPCEMPSEKVINFVNEAKNAG